MFVSGSLHGAHPGIPRSYLLYFPLAAVLVIPPQEGYIVLSKG